MQACYHCAIKVIQMMFSLNMELSNSGPERLLFETLAVSMSLLPAEFEIL